MTDDDLDLIYDEAEIYGIHEDDLSQILEQLMVMKNDEIISNILNIEYDISLMKISLFGLEILKKERNLIN